MYTAVAICIATGYLHYRGYWHIFVTTPLLAITICLTALTSTRNVLGMAERCCLDTASLNRQTRKRR